MKTLTLDPDVKDTLQSIVELGYVSVENGAIIELLPPREHFFLKPEVDRWTPTVKYIRDYAGHHPAWSGEFFVCLYDGWREYSEPADPDRRTYVPWSEVDRSKFLSTGTHGEPRFCHGHEDPTIYPELPRKVLAFDRHLGDRNVLLIPDSDFISTGFASFLQDVHAGDVPWEQKASKVVWRGMRRRRGKRYAYFDHGGGPANPRELVAEFSMRPDYFELLDASFKPTPIAWMLRHKYLLDIDGFASAWSSLFWKLSSNSLVWKTRTHWEQWYYDQLKPHEHFLPLSDFFHVHELFRWCEQNQERCRAIVASANRLVRSLTYNFAVAGYEIH